MTAERTASDGPVVRDKRRIDPETGEVRTDPTTGSATRRRGRPAASPSEAPADGAAVDADSRSLDAELAERTADLQRLSRRVRQLPQAGRPRP